MFHYGDTSGSTTVTYSTVDGTATVPENYMAVSPTVLTFGPGETVKTIDVTINHTRGPNP